MKLWCIYGGTPLPEIRWRKQGGALPWGRTTFDNYGKTLVIKHVDFADAGDYTCEASNGVGLAKSHSIELKVLAKPRFILEPEIQVWPLTHCILFILLPKFCLLCKIMIL